MDNPGGLLSEGGATGCAHFFRDSGGGAVRVVLGFPAGVRVSVDVGEDGMGSWGRAQTLGVGVRRGRSGLGAHLSRYETVSGALGC